MKEFCYTVKNPVGIHARPAGMLSSLAKEFECEITVSKGEAFVSAKKLIMLMALGIACGDTVKVTFDGADEWEAFDKVSEFFCKNL